MPKLLAVDMEQERSAASSVALNGGIFTKVFQIFLIKTQNKCLLLRKMNFHMVEDMYILYNTVLFVECVVLCSYRK